MNPRYLRSRNLIFAAIICLTWQLFAIAADEQTPTKDQIKQFLLTAKVVHSQGTKKGITDTKRVTLSDGTITHDASFQSVDEHQYSKQLASGTELHSVHSYTYNIAAYELAEFVAIDDLLPVYVERKEEGKTGSLSCGLALKVSEQDSST